LAYPIEKTSGAYLSHGADVTGKWGGLPGEEALVVAAAVVFVVVIHVVLCLPKE
jgi:hypothetical protein